ncbi:DUF2911 domain-containing protein [Longitalea luteola]|uniref:DUF2911 domain-containing protein n=1 Tax=Longitalea luteola TaxID=2812563 RepID=UPI001A96ACF3|nr:DUF2911 domain-containing protein [Longitalea luteola]
MKNKSVYVLFLLLITTACNNQPGSNKPATNSHEHHNSTSRKAYGATRDYADSVNEGIIAVDTLKGSPQRVAMANIGNAHVHIEYHSPGVKNRVIWGGLVPYDQVWVSGAHNATAIDFSKDVVIMGNPVKAGTYAFFTIPGKENWTVILNTRYDQHLADEYNQKEDLARYQVTPVKLDKPVPRLTYGVYRDTDTTGSIELTWEKIKLVLPVTATRKR